MDREFVLVVLALLASAPMLLVSGLLPERRPAAASARTLERLCWLRIWQPLLPTAIAIATVIGWALREPDDAEGVPWWMLVICVLFAGPLVRGLLRAAWAARARPLGIMVGTTGLLRARAVIAAAFERETDPDAYRAALEHEAAHVRHHDPLRLWIAQFVTDLQWPMPAPKARFARWRDALEFARDEEARRRGIDGSDLAAAVIAAAQFGQRRGLAPSLGLGDDEVLRERIVRLLEPLPPHDESAPGFRAAAAVASSLVAAGVLGALQGEHVVRTLLGGVP